MTPHPEKRLIAIDAEWVSLARAVIETIDAQAASALGKVLTAWDEGATREDVEAVIGPDMEYVTGGCSCARCNAQRALYTAVTGAPREANHN